MLTEDGVKSHLDEREKHLNHNNSGLSQRLPLRMELFSLDQRRERGHVLGQEHHAGKRLQGGDTLLKRLHDNEAVLRKVHRTLVDDVNEKKQITPVGEWLVDNFYVIEEQISLAQRHLPRNYLLELPRLSNPGRMGIPRVYDLAEHIIAYGDSRVEVTDVSVLITAYQEVTPLRLGELWAIPIMLRLALIENIRRMAVLAAKCRDDREIASRWADALIKVDEKDPKSLVLVLADMARAQPVLTGSFVAEFKRKLQGRGAGMKLPLQWVEQNLNEQDRSVDQVVNEENHEQAVLEISMRNCITSLRGLNVTDWNEFVETMSKVEAVLRKDPGDVYGKMDFATRDDYRRVVERLAKKSGKEETTVAACCLDLAREAALTAGKTAAPAHVGYYLVGPGERELRLVLGHRGGISDFLREASTRLSLLLYLGAITVLTAIFSAVTIWLTHAGGVRGDMLLVMSVLLVFTCCHLAVGLVNYLATQLVRPHSLPRLNFRKGIPAEHRTLVVVPVLLGNEKSVGKLLRALETHYLNNRGANIHFGLLTDFPDAPQETMPEDERLLNLCRLGIIKLNDRYPDDGGDNFFLFHRPRTWNESERVWMGWERKRGKLEDLNRYLRGVEQPFSCIEGTPHMLSNVKYVITLDADTQMARESAWQLVGTMAHPLVRPVYDGRLGRVTSGHGILQPRVDATLSGAHRSMYARMSASEIGIDPYTRASSDVYQDLFDEGSFIGKGIYDVDIFDRGLGRRFPDNKILSHDLLEGCVVRSGLINDVKLYEDPPATYLMDVDRRHRWVRGDWQIASFLAAKEIRGGRKINTKPLNVLSQWKVFDNLRRSLVSIVIFLLLVFGFVVLRSPGLYLAVVAAVFLLPVAVAGLWGLFRKSPDKTFRQHLRNSLSSTGKQAVQSIFKFSCVPFEAYFSADAIIRSLWRQVISHRLLLQWNPSDNSIKKDYTHFLPILGRMWAGPVAAIAMTWLIADVNPDLLWYAVPLLLLWCLSPLFVTWLSKPRPVVRESLTEKQETFLRHAARRIWLFFETFVTEAENHLPPDNYQEYPVGRIAHRTSPTNMGLSLLANLSAHDFGYISTGKLVERTEHAFETMNRMERFRGHFYNWYDTRSLEILQPAYISTVDSGNMAAHMLVLASGLRSLTTAPVINPAIFSGLLDTLELALEEAENPASPDLVALTPLRQRLCEDAANPPTYPGDIYAAIASVAAEADTLEKQWADVQGEDRTRTWVAAFARQCRDALADCRALMPWAADLPSRPAWQAFEQLCDVPSLVDAAVLGERLGVDATVPADLAAHLEKAMEQARHRLAVIQKTLVECEDISHIDYDFLYDKSKRLLAIGYNVSERRLDQSFYDLLASEARLAAYLGVAQNKIPQASWFALGRMLTLSDRRPLLISWSGSMFEYLMPLLVMPTYEDTLLDETYKACVSIQMNYGASRNVPWGISESGYNLFDSDQNYQYRAFGVPELGLRHALSDDLVIAPYATMLATMVFPARATANLMNLHERGFQSSYGFYEAIDFTPSRMPHDAKYAVIRSYMAHHQGMSLVALAQTLLERPMHKRFDANPMLHSATMLLQEMVPAEKAMYFHSTYSPEIVDEAVDEEAPARLIQTPNSPHPDVQLLSNGSYHVMVSASGGGYSRYRDLSVTRWREDPTRDNWGSFCYIRDRETGEVWSNTYQPTQTPAKSFEAVFTEGKAEFIRRDEEFDCRTEIVVAPEDNVEVRRLRITNRSPRRRVLDLTSYAEVCLNSQAADDSHQAFSKLFIQTHIVRERQGIICSRRARSAKEARMPNMFHMLAVRGVGGGVVSYETDRLAFLGRGNDATHPQAVWAGSEPLADGEGAVLDPVVAIRSPVTLDSGETVIIDLVTGVGDDEAATMQLLEKYQDERMAEKAFDMAYTHGQLLLRQLDVSETDAQRYCQLASSIVYTNPALRADPATLMRNRKGQSGLWGYAISGDWPILLVKIAEPSRLQLVKQVVQAHTYWRQKGLKVDLVIWNEDQTGYRQTLHDQIVSLAGAVLDDATMEQPGGIFIRSPDRINEEDRILLQSVARVVLSDGDGMLDEQLRKLMKAEMASNSTIVQYRKFEPVVGEDQPVEVEKLLLPNEYGGFSKDGSEYVIVSGGSVATPLPWVNVMANPEFGTVVSESGGSYTWSENAHEHRLTPWNNDPVSDATGEAIYIRDEQTGAFWCPTPLPVRTEHQYVTRHGFGYTTFEHNEHGIYSCLTVHVDRDEPVKFYTLTIRNNSSHRRNLSATAFVEWVLGDLRTKTAMHVATGVDSRSGALLARNHYSEEFRHRTAFLDCDDPGRTVCGDRREFLGRNGSPASPVALQRPTLSGRVGPGLDPCGSIQTKFNLGPGQEREIVFRLGVGKTLEEARTLVKQFRGSEASRESLDKVKEFWRTTLGAVQVDTPDLAFNLMANGWLLYQVLSCRFWGRSATYQSGGAFGFRDQLQDSLALLYAEPALVRGHILESAAHQFLEGDVQHWWHPPAGRGVRTRCSDDYLWLPYVTERYIAVTGDTDILDEKIRFITGRPLREDEESYYDAPQRSEDKTSLYDHCRRSIENGLRFGEHGLPLMGSGDWNDGMDQVGIEGKGESVWLGFFLHDTLVRFGNLAESRGDSIFADRCRGEAKKLAENIEEHAWDGEWYRRAYFDDGSPLGSAQNPECRIDSLAQSWSAISGVGSPERVKMAMQSLDDRLIDHDHMVIKLFEPPFDKSDMHPGYIKGYVPGVRENGGQYTHGAIWVGFAYAALRDQEKTWETLRLLNPVNHALDRTLAERYKVEPYVISADIYSNPQHRGRGGWSWYTGSASWLYRFMLEEVLGFKLTPDRIRVDPCVPASWSGFRIRYQAKKSCYDISVTTTGERESGETVNSEGVKNGDATIVLADDQQEHQVELKL